MITVYVTDSDDIQVPVCGYIEWHPDTMQHADELVNTLRKLGIVKKHGYTINVVVE